jgi:hypothetical protein
VIETGDIVRINQWQHCLWRVSKIEGSVYTIKLMGGFALPPDWGPTSHCVEGALVRVLDEEMSPLSVLAMASMDCHPKTHTASS